MTHKITIGGNQVELAWTQEIASRYAFRVSKIGGAPSISDFRNPKKASAAVVTVLWLVLPPAIHQQYATPEDLYIAINFDDSDEVKSIFDGVLAVIGDMDVSDEKKSTSKKSPSQKSNLD